MTFKFLKIMGIGFILSVKKLLPLLLLAGFQVNAVTITYLGPENYNPDVNQTNANLGIDDTFIVEDFEDTILIDGLTITDNVDGVGTYRTLNYSNWDGSSSLYGHPGFALHSPLFSFDTAVYSFGIGLAGYQPSANTTEFFVNGVSQGALLFDENGSRNGYLFITAESGESISSIGFTQPENDGIAYDHLAVQYNAPVPVPVPATMWLFGSGLLGLIGVARRRVFT
jgi:hypothetical protein